MSLRPETFYEITQIVIVTSYIFLKQKSKADIRYAFTAKITKNKPCPWRERIQMN